MKRSRSFVTGVHIIGWILFLSLILGFVSSFSDEQDIANHLFSPAFIIFFLVYAFIFYFNTNFLFPAFYMKKRFASYIVIVTGLFIGVYFLQPFDRLISARHTLRNASTQNGMPPPFREPPGEGRPPMDGLRRPPPPNGGQSRKHTDIVSIILFAMVLSFSSVFLIGKQWRLTEQRVAHAETDRATAELSFLKAQINPHFLFNTLNNIYSMAVTKNEHTADSIMKLSHIMRYLTDDVNQRLVPLQSEADCASDYIALQRLRLSKKVTLDFSVQGNLENQLLPPLVLMPFIENAFKYGVSSHEPSAISIRIVSGNDGIRFHCSNKIFNKVQHEQGTGIGIANTEKRLEHQYGNRYKLSISESEGWFTVDLSLPAQTTHEPV